jgi:hypothetical protein
VVSAREAHKNFRLRRVGVVTRSLTT